MSEILTIDLRELAGRPNGVANDLFEALASGIVSAADLEGEACWRRNFRSSMPMCIG